MTWRDRLWWVALLAGSVLGGCDGGTGPPLAGRLSDLVAAEEFAVGSAAEAALELPGVPAIESIDVGGEVRSAVVLPPGSMRWRGQLPAGARLVGGVHLISEVSAPLSASVTVVGQLERQVVAELAAPTGANDWLDLDVDLGRFGGRVVELELTAKIGGVPVDGSRVAWAPVVVRGPPAPSPDRPNVLVILVDTMRADRLSAGGGERLTTPNVDRLLAAPGVVAERAYAQAPWTLPSVISLLSGRSPGEVIGSERGAFSLPRGPDVLAAAFREMGYRTAGFVANATLHRGNGFDHGFQTFYSPPSLDSGMLELHGDDVTRRASRWLQANDRQPFFLYVHYIDPHDPYESPLTVAGRSRFFPDYEGPLTGRHVHGIYLGKHQLSDPERDVAHLAALYDDEVLFVDQQIGLLVDGLPAAVAADTIFVFTSDHGEELDDHGGWKHGRTLYEEQLRVPLVLRWDGRWPAGGLLAAPVRLLDLAPTLIEAAGGEARPSWEGRNLEPYLEGRKNGSSGRPPIVYAQHFGSGPVRATAILGAWKLILFDAETRFATDNEHEAILAKQELGRLERIELYDLADDPGEERNVSAVNPDMVRRLSAVIHQRLGRRLPGLRVLVRDVVPGRSVRGTVRFDRPPKGWTSYFLGPDDHVELVGDTLRFELEGDLVAKGVRLEEEGLGIVETMIEGGWLPVVGPDGRDVGTGVVEAEALRAPGFPGRTDGPALLLWEPESRALEEEMVDEETMRRLEALGYTG